MTPVQSRRRSRPRGLRSGISTGASVALLGKAALALFFDIVPEAIAEHDDWHTHEHMPERLAIPGFLRGTRWTAVSGSPRYFVMYEVGDVGVLTSPAYLERLNNPTPWSRKMMPHYRGMKRSLCRLKANIGLGIGQLALALHEDWSARGLTDLASTPGLASAHVLESAAIAPMTREQEIRGPDISVDCITVISGYDAKALAHLHEGAGVYRMEYSILKSEVTR